MKRARLEHLSRLCLVIAVAALCWRIWMVRSGNVLASYVLLPSRMDGLALGAWLAIQVTRPGMLDRLARYAAPVLAACIVAVLAIVAKSGQAGWEMPLMSTVGLSLTAVASTAFIALLVAGGQRTVLSRAVAVAPLRFFGRYAYGLYVLADAGTRLLDLTGIPTLVPKIVLGSAVPRAIWNLALILLFTTGLALLSWTLIEQPALALKRYFPYAQGRRVVPAYSVPAPGEGLARAELDQA